MKPLLNVNAAKKKRENPSGKVTSISTAKKSAYSLQSVRITPQSTPSHVLRLRKHAGSSCFRRLWRDVVEVRRPPKNIETWLEVRMPGRAGGREVTVHNYMRLIGRRPRSYVLCVRTGRILVLRKQKKKKRRRERKTAKLRT